ncbi:MAG: hypothetical protein JOZ44_14940, partial [Acidobacteria bacterium]|nr:hypothetical protein [Acidobacteriota bacterium]
MKLSNTTQGAPARAWRVCVLTLSLLLSAVMAVAVPNKNSGPKVGDVLGHHHKGWAHTAPDIDDFPVNADGTVDVLVQFKSDAFEPDKNFHPNDRDFSGKNAGREKQAVVDSYGHFKADHRSKYQQQLHAVFK